MLLTPHVFIGLAIAKLLPNPFLAIPVALLSHFLGDITPHWDFFSKTRKEERLRGWRPIAVMAELGLGIAVGVFFTTRALWLQQDPKAALLGLICGIMAVLPDALEAPYIYTDKAPLFIKRLTDVQRRLQTQAPMLLGIIIQLLIISACLLYLL